MGSEGGCLPQFRRAWRIFPRSWVGYIAARTQNERQHRSGGEPRSTGRRERCGQPSRDPPTGSSDGAPPTDGSVGEAPTARLSACFVSASRRPRPSTHRHPHPVTVGWRWRRSWCAVRLGSSSGGGSSPFPDDTRPLIVDADRSPIM